MTLQPQAGLCGTVGLTGSQWDCLHRKALLRVTTPKYGSWGVIMALTELDLMQ